MIFFKLHIGAVYIPVLACTLFFCTNGSLKMIWEVEFEKKTNHEPNYIRVVGNIGSKCAALKSRGASDPSPLSPCARVCHKLTQLCPPRPLSPGGVEHIALDREPASERAGPRATVPGAALP